MPNYNALSHYTVCGYIQPQIGSVGPVYKPRPQSSPDLTAIVKCKIYGLPTIYN